MRTEGLKRGLIYISLLFALVISMAFITTPVLAPGVIEIPTTVEVEQGQEFTLRFRLFWDIPGELGYFSFGIYWDCPENDPSENFTFENAAAYFDLDNDNLPDPGLDPIDIIVDRVEGPVGTGTRYAIIVHHDAGEPRDGEFNVDLRMRASGAGGVPHVPTDNHPIVIPGTIDIPEGPVWYSYPPPNPYITVRVLPEVQRWDALITATFSEGSDDAIFGVRPDATAGFDNAYDFPEGPPPPLDAYVQAFFYYPKNPPSLTKLHMSYIAPEDFMEWPLRVSYCNGADNITLSWNLENVPSDYAVLLYEDENLVVDMRAVDNYTFQTAGSKFDFTVRAAVAAEWRLIETWTGTVQTPAEWQLIETWTGIVEAPAEWQLVKTWTGTIEAPAEWQLTETWTGTMKAPAVWRLIESWTGTVEALVMWQLIETWTGTIQASAGWQLIESWLGTVLAPSQWQLIEVWTRAIEAPAQWQPIETWAGTARTIGWKLIETWTGTVKTLVPPPWQLIESWTGTIEAPVYPSKPTLKSPADGTITNDNKPTFEWTVGLNADNHQLFVDNDPDFTSPVENRLFGPTDNTYTLENSLPDDNYSWKVIAINALGENQSSVWTFAIDTVPPAAPSLISPADGTITNDSTPTFDWSDVSEAENYDLLVDNDANFSSPDIKVTVSKSTYTPTDELPNDNYSWKVGARDAANNVGDWSSTWTLLISIARDVDVFISPSHQSGLPGSTLSYIVTVKNEGNVSDNYTLTATDSADWGPTLSKDSLALPPKAYDTVTLAVTIPTDASVGDQDNITITAESTVDTTVSDSARCTAQATAVRRRVEVSISPESKSGPPGEALTYTVTIVNEGEVEDTYDLTVTDALTWVPIVSPTSLTIAAGNSDTATLRVTIPAGTASGTEDEITVTATSRTDLTVSDSAACIASAAAVRGVEVSISPENQSGAPEEMLTYEVTVKNEGNIGDTYILSTTGAPDWLPRVENTSLTLSAGKVGKTTLTVTIPPGASEGDSITVNVSAISVGDPTVTGSDTYRIIVVGAPERPEVELPFPLAISVALIGAAIIVPAYLLRWRSIRAARRRVLRGPRV